MYILREYTRLQMYPRKYLHRVSQTPKPSDIDKLRHFLRPLEPKGGDKKEKKTSSYKILYGLKKRKRVREREINETILFFPPSLCLSRQNENTY